MRACSRSVWARKIQPPVLLSRLQDPYCRPTLVNVWTIAATRNVVSPPPRWKAVSVLALKEIKRRDHIDSYSKFSLFLTDVYAISTIAQEISTPNSCSAAAQYHERLLCSNTGVANGDMPYETHLRVPSLYFSVYCRANRLLLADFFFQAWWSFTNRVN